MKDSEQAKRRVGGAADGRSNPPAPVRNPKPGTKNQKPGTRNLASHLSPPTSYLSPRKAVVLAAGFGTRLRPFTSAVPKPLLPVWGETMLSRVVEWLRGQGADDIVVNCHYLHEQIEEWCAKNGCRAIYEPEILGTGGVLNPLRDWIGGDDFWLVNGDIVFELPEAPVFADGKARQIPGASLLGRCIVSEDGPRTIEVEPDGSLVTNWHSPDPGWSGTWTYCGIALLKAKVLDYVKPQGFSSIIEAYEAAMMDGWFIRAYAPKNLLWTDAGTVESYIALNQDGEDDNAFADIPQLKAALEASGPSQRLAFLGARGSDRAFFKTDNAYVIVYDDGKRAENARYAGHAKWLKAHDVRVPEVLADCPALKTLALENAGGEDLKGRSRTRGEDRLYDYVAVVEELAKFNSLAPDGIALEPPFDAALYRWERELFAEHCLGTRFHKVMPPAVEKELEAVAERLLNEPPALVHRDFQSTNIIFRSGGAFSFIDFQGMRMGAAAYDLASLLYDPYVDLREGERRALAALYARKAGRPEIADVLPFAAVERLVQALGAFGRLASVGKPEFGKFVLPALQNLLAAADDAGLDALGALAEDLIACEGRGGGSHHHHHHNDGCTCGCHHHNDDDGEEP